MIVGTADPFYTEEVFRETVEGLLGVKLVLLTGMRESVLCKRMVSGPWRFLYRVPEPTVTREGGCLSSKWKNVFWSGLLTALGIACFPVNPLVLTGLVETESYVPLLVIGVVIWLFGMVLVMAPIVMFPGRGGVPKGKSYVHTTRLVDSGIYAAVRHPQYTGGVYSIFLTTMLFYPHWLFFALGVVGIATIYISCREEDKMMVEKFGDQYEAYMERVPRMNIFLGLFRLLRSNKNHGAS